MTLPRPTALETVVLQAGSTTAFVAPERGALVTRFFVGDRPVFFLDEATLLDASKNVRGGAPILFPSPGKLESGRFSFEGKTGTLGQHGFARNEPWEIVERRDDRVTLRLRSNERTRAVFPWDFAFTLEYILEEGKLSIRQHVEATSAATVPCAVGFHPYFFVRDGDKPRTRIPTPATRAWDNVTKRTIDLAGPIDLTASELDLHLIDHERPGATLELADGHRIELRGHAASRPIAYPRWVIWTLGGKDFVCLEPWSAPANALATTEGLSRVERGAPWESMLEIKFV